MAIRASSHFGDRPAAIVERPDAPAPMPDSNAQARNDARSEARNEDGAEARFRRMVNDQFDFVWRSLRGLGVPASSVDDAAQQVFLVGAQKLATIAEGSERAFLFATARGIASNARRSRARNREHADEAALVAHPDSSPDPEELTASKRAREALDKILDGMPEELRTIFVLYELEGLTMAAIAELCAIPPGTAASRLRRAREEFQQAARLFAERKGP